MTALEIFKENETRENYWFCRTMKNFDYIMQNNRKTEEMEEIKNSIEFQFDDAEVEHLLSLVTTE